MKENTKPPQSTNMMPKLVDPDTYIEYKGIIAFKEEPKGKKTKKSEIQSGTPRTDPVKWYNVT